MRQSCEKLLRKNNPPNPPLDGGTGAVEDIERYAFGTPQAAPMGVPRQQSLSSSSISKFKLGAENL